jgi:hypothetical protein
MGGVHLNDPHVEELRYRIETGGELVFDNPPPVDDETNAFHMTLADGVASFKMNEHYPTEESARKPLEEYLQAWELDVALQYGRSVLRFVFAGKEIIDRNPPPPGTPQTVEVGPLAIVGSVGSLTVVPHLKHYIEPPANFVASADARAMWEQYEAYVEGRDRLLPMAYSCLTRLEFRAGTKDKRRKAASMYRIEPGVLDKLGELTSNLGDEVGARKLTPQSELRSPTPQEVAWIEAALRRIIRRAGEYAADPQEAWPQVKMSDLPPL